VTRSTKKRPNLMELTGLHQCEYCRTTFKQEHSLFKHRCKEMMRYEQLQTLEGQAAWMYYQSWMKKKNKSVPDSKVFSTSRYYTSFTKFAQFAGNVGIIDVEQYIDLMNELDYSPTVWTNDIVYAKYIEYLDSKTTPKDHAKRMVDAMFQIADVYHCDTSEVFKKISASDVMKLLRQRKFTPWILLLSGEFKMLLARSTAEQRNLLNSLIRPQKWQNKFAKHPDTVEIMRKLVKELNI